MKYAALFLLTIPAFAQIGNNRPTPAAASMPPNAGGNAITAPPKPGKVSLAAFVNLERGFDAKLAALADANGSVDLLGATRGVYLDGYGLVFTTEMGLILTPSINPFNPTISPAEKN